MAATFYDLNSKSGQKKLDEYLLTRSYISGLQASKDDITVHAAFSKAPPSQYVNVSRWYNHINTLLSISGVSGKGCGVIVEGFDFAPITEADATPPTDDAKASAAEKKKKFCLISMKKLEEASRSFQMDDGLIMKKLVPDGHGIKKVRIRLAIHLIEDKLKAEPINVCVQVKSCDIVPSSTKSNLRPHSTPGKWNLRILE